MFIEFSEIVGKSRGRHHLNPPESSIIFKNQALFKGFHPHPRFLSLSEFYKKKKGVPSNKKQQPDRIIKQSKLKKCKIP